MRDAVDLCVLVLLNGHGGSRSDSHVARWASTIDLTWATNLTFFISLDRNVSFTSSNLTLTSAQYLHLRSLGLARRNDALELWSRLVVELTRPSGSSSVATRLRSCNWFMHVDMSVYVNIQRLRYRLECLRGVYPEFYALAPFSSKEKGGLPGDKILADERSGGYLLGRRLLLDLSSHALRTRCHQDLGGHNGVPSDKTQVPPGVIATACIQLLVGLAPQRIADPDSEVLLGASGLMALRRSSPGCHCVFAVACRGPPCLLEAHRLVTTTARLQHGGCYERGLEKASDALPLWNPLVREQLLACPLRAALSREGPLDSFATLLSYLESPEQPTGTAAQKLRRAHRPWELCILVGVSSASAEQVRRAEAAVATWLRPLVSRHRWARRWRRPADDVVAFLYSRQPLRQEWASFTLSLFGDLDLRHPKYNAHRFLYLWATLATHHARDCNFFLKADPDSYVNVPALRRKLRNLDASAPLYLGTVAVAHARPGGNVAADHHEPFAHGSGYILSKGALLTAATSLRHCVAFFAWYYLESQEDMTLAACLRAAGVHASSLAPVIYDFGGEGVDRLATMAPPPLLLHPVPAQTMAAVHIALQSSASKS